MRQFRIGWLYFAVCSLSLGCYFLFTHSLRFLFSAWPYHKTLYRLTFPAGFAPAKLVTPLAQTPFASGEFLILVFFVLSCLGTGWLAWALLGRGLDRAPAVLLFALAAAIIPTQLAALVLWPDGRGYLTSRVILVLGLALNAVMAVPVLLKRRPRSAGPVGGAGFPLLALLFLIPAAVLFFLAFLLGASNLQGYDALAYHLPLAASWHAYGRLTTGYDIQYFLPGNAELLMRWMFVEGTDRLVFLVPWLGAAGCIFLLYRIGVAMKQPKIAAIAAACSAVTFPVIPFLATVAYTDVVSVLFVLMAVLFLLHWRDSGLERKEALFACGLALGLGAGTKMSMLPPALAITLAAAWLVVRHPGFWGRDPAQPHLVRWNASLLRTNALILFPAMIPGGFYWFLRNLARFGNPFYPVSILGLPGYPSSAILPVDAAFRDNTLARIVYPWQELAYGSPYDDGTGAVFAGIVIPTLIFWWLIGRRTGSGVMYFLIVSGLAMFAVSNTTTPRYGIFAFLISFLLVGEMWTARARGIRLLAPVAFLVPVLVLAQSLGGGILFQHLRGPLDGAERFGLPAMIDRAPAGKVLNAGGAFYTYGLMGKDFRHDVVTLFRKAEPADMARFRVNYVLAPDDRVAEFEAVHEMEKLGDRDGVAFLRLLP
ncbi:MAG: glycosyltransferase family 39 protein [Bryobacterales bacterium]|nr:glycosyltransferase family 39 protein [Bryobacterales bacterium]